MSPAGLLMISYFSGQSSCKLFVYSLMSLSQI
jgi:hypothetical protein